MKVIKFIARILGAGFFFGGINFFLGALSSLGETRYVITTILRFFSGAAYIFTGYGLFMLKKWSLYGIGAMLISNVLIILHNQYLFNRSEKEMLSIGFLIVFVFVIYTFKEKIFEKK